MGHIDEERVHAIKSNIRFQNWLRLNESALLLMNDISPSPSDISMSFVSAQTYKCAMLVSADAAEQTNAPGQLVPLVFFCSQHRDYPRDPYATPEALGMRLLLQLVDKYRGFDSTDLGAAFEELRPDENGRVHDLDLILQAFGYLVSRLPASVIVVLIVDSLETFAHPRDRGDRLAHLVAGLVAVYHAEHAAMLKFLFTIRMDH